MLVQIDNPKPAVPWLKRLRKKTTKTVTVNFNPNHDEQGRFSEGDGAGAVNEWYGALTAHDKQLLFSWGVSGQKIRQMQASKIPADAAALAEWKSLLDSAPRYEGVVYRGLSRVDNDTIRAWIDSEEIELSSDQSASLSQQEATKWSGGGRVNQANVLWEIEQKSGAHLESSTGVFYGDEAQTGGVNEQEVVIRNGQRYKVESVQFIDAKGQDVLSPGSRRELAKDYASSELEMAKEQASMMSKSIERHQSLAKERGHAAPSWVRAETSRLNGVQERIKQLSQQDIELPADWLPHGGRYGSAGYYHMKLREL